MLLTSSVVFQLGYTKCCCFYANEAAERKTAITLLKNVHSGQKSVSHQILVNPMKLLLSALHFKFALM
jgi:hypothetical protein